MEKICLMLAAIFAASSCLALDQPYQISLEIFDENRETTVCTYRSREGDLKIMEHDGRFFCPRVITDATDLKDPAAHLFDSGELVAKTP